MRRAGQVLLSALILALVLGAMPLARWVDRILPGEPLRDTWGALRWHEDWASAPRLAQGLNQDWLAGNQLGFRRIAHALGGAGTPEANSLAALHAARAAKMTLFEVDLWLDANGVLRCFHGVEDGVGPSALGADDCTLEKLMDEVAGRPEWLVLDLKTEFRRTGAAVMALVGKRGGAKQLVFQLYHPDDVADFARWSAQSDLPSPIVTVYASHRGVQYIADQLERIGVVAMAMPLEKRQWLRRRPRGVALLLHPVHDCAAWTAASVWGATGAFVALGAACPQAVAGSPN
jgi:hypothetical protein